MRKPLAVALGMLLVVSVACGSGVSGAQTYTVGVDAASPEGKNFQYSTFFPSTIKASAGDSITFTNASSQAPHTITFGVEADRSNQPPVVLPNGTESPVVTAPCFAEAGSTAKLTTCPTKTLPEYNGSGYWNSGFLVPAVAPEGPKSTTVKLADTIEPGSYAYVCVLHGPMAGVIEVVEEGDREPVDAVTETADEQLATVKAEADAIADPQVAANTVAAGWSEGVTAVNRFLPETLEVKRGATVTWEAFSDFEPHTVSFGSFKAGVPGPGQAPSGPKDGAPYTSGDASSGMFGKPGGPFPPGPYKVSFPNAGTYTYVCVLHPQMVGTVKVT